MHYKSSRFKVSLFTISVSTALAATSNGAWGNQKAEALCDKAIEEFGAAETRDLAIKHIDEALSINSKEARYWQSKAMFLLKLDESERALPCINRSLQLNSNSKYAYILKADILSSLNRFDEALSIVNHMIKLDPCAENLVTRAKIFMRQGKFELAEKELDKLVKSNSNDALARQKRAIVAIQLKHWQKAIEDLSYLIDKAPVKNTSYYEDLLARAKAYTETKQYEKAIADCKVGLKGQPEVPQFYRALLKVYEASGNASEAKRMRKKLEDVEDDFQPPKSDRF